MRSPARLLLDAPLLADRLAITPDISAIRPTNPEPGSHPPDGGHRRAASCGHRLPWDLADDVSG